MNHPINAPVQRPSRLSVGTDNLSVETDTADTSSADTSSADTSSADTSSAHPPLRVVPRLARAGWYPRAGRRPSRWRRWWAPVLLAVALGASVGLFTTIALIRIGEVL